MCGIIGFASKTPFHMTVDAVLASGRDAMAHRGPDDAGFWWSDDRRVGLAQRRLAIVDLSANGHQPMLDHDARLAIVFNGEIYNFRDLRRELQGMGATFSTRTDTEVILKAYGFWGMAMLDRLEGMFALALHDIGARKLYLARDRAGEKPLYLYAASGMLRFASELKGLLADPEMPRRIDPLALDCYLAAGFVPGSLCMLEGYAKLLPAHAMEFDLETGRTRQWCYWTPPAPPTTPDSAEALVDELHRVLNEAVARQLVADVPVGVLLSGGVDSSLIAAMASENTTTVRTFTVRFPGHGELDETEHARLVARYLGTEHTELEARAEDAFDLLPTLARQFDEPLGDSSLIPTYLVSRLVRQHCTVALGGDGGDELFGGYDHHRSALVPATCLERLPAGLRRLLGALAERSLPAGTRGRNHLRALARDRRTGHPYVASHFDPGARGRMTGAALATKSAETVMARGIVAGQDALQAATRADFLTYLPDDILIKVDRASMACSLEMRAPFLDRQMLDFAFGRVPSVLKADASGGKLLPKRLAEMLFPPDFDRQRKQGFSIPLGNWLRQEPLAGFFRDVLTGPDTLLPARDAAVLLDGHGKGRSNSERLFILAMLELWKRDYGAHL
jgi:asparagine synthase (glutamine-hydrolysing)